jgi:hypothetical protein
MSTGNRAPCPIGSELPANPGLSVRNFKFEGLYTVGALEELRGSANGIRPVKRQLTKGQLWEQ